MKKLVMFSGWVISIILVAILFFSWNYTNQQLVRQSDNYTVNYAALNATYAQLAANYNNLRVADANMTAYYASYIPALNASFQQQAKDLVATMNTTISASNAQWQATLNQTIMQRDAYWSTTLTAALATQDAQWRTTLATALVAQNNTWRQVYTDLVNQYNALAAKYNALNP